MADEDRYPPDIMYIAAALYAYCILIYVSHVTATSEANGKWFIFVLLIAYFISCFLQGRAEGRNKPAFLYDIICGLCIVTLACLDVLAFCGYSLNKTLFPLGLTPLVIQCGFTTYNASWALSRAL